MTGEAQFVHIERLGATRESWVLLLPLLDLECLLLGLAIAATSFLLFYLVNYLINIKPDISWHLVKPDNKPVLPDMGPADLFYTIF